MLSGYTDLKAVTTAVNRGELFCFLTKPWDDKELLETVRDAFHHHESRRHDRP
jgi:FixJ family two-component response regulator